MEGILAKRLPTSRGGTVLLGVAAAVLAGLVLLIYLNRYRESVAAGDAPTTVLVARKVIEQGTPGAVVGNRRWFTTAQIARDDIKEGALVDPALLRDRVAVADIYPGQQLT